MKKLLLVNDLSGIGKVALAPAITITNCLGFEVSTLPTCILSTHTGGFPDIYIDDYSKGMDGFLAQWQDLDLNFDALITGYFRNAKQIKKVLDFKEKTPAKNATLIVDPVMADNGKMYSGFDKNYVQYMNELCVKADLILPNFTEACLLTNKNFREENADLATIKELCLELSDKGKRSVIITGIKTSDDLIIAYYDKNIGEFGYESCEKLPYNFFGTGDMFTSIVSGKFLKGDSIKEAVRFANEWILKCLTYTIESNTDIKYGVKFEAFLKDLI